MDHGVEVRFLSANTELFARSWGEGQPLVLLHGSGLATYAMFSELALELMATCRVLTCDIRGFGKSLSRDPKDHTWRQYARDVVALLDHLTLPTAVVGGYSFGAAVALAAALRHADRVSGLMLVEPGYAGEEIGQTESQTAVWARGRAFFDRASVHGLEVSLLASATSERERRELRRAVAEHDEASFLAAHRGELATTQPFAGLSALQSVTAPTLMVSGTDDAHDPGIARWYAEQLPTVTVANPATSELAGVIQSFMRELRQR